MATASVASATLTMEQYLQTSYSPDVDFVDDHIEERHLGEHDHGRLQGHVFAIFFSHEREWHVRAIQEQRTRVSASKIRIPDVAILRAEAPRDPVAELPPLICIEILSREDRLSRTVHVLADYHAMGVPNIWIIDPAQRVAYTFGNEGLSAPVFDVLSVPGTDIRLDLAPLFADLDGEAAGATT